MNGDGYVFRIDLSPGQANLQTELVKPACYYADVATTEGNANKFGKLFGFQNWGMTRMSLELGSRNELNTAITPFQFQADSAPRLLACYDAGRPWEIDPVNLETITPIGANSEWVASTPAKAFPFGIVQSSAHPSFDPVTKEMFFVNFTKSIHTIINNDEVMELIKKNENLVKQSFQNIISRIHHLTDTGEILKTLKQHLLEPVVAEEHKIAQWLHGIFHQGHLHRDQTNSQIEGITTIAASMPATPPNNQEEDAVYLLKWNGEAAPLQKWKVLDQNGHPVKIIQCMHQTTITQDYIILADASFKFSLDLLFNHPFSDTKIESFLRKFLTVQQLPYLDIYIIARTDLDPSKPTITCKK
jgi:carotenoid cleavage dioxygenase-like enzyme